MKKSELKNIIKECVKEVIFEEGVLSGIVAEVAQGFGTATMIQENTNPPRTKPTPSVKQEVLNAVARNSYEDIKGKFSNPKYFEGTSPIVESKSQASALSGLDPQDPGVDITNIPGFGNWSSVARNK